MTNQGKGKKKKEKRRSMEEIGFGSGSHGKEKEEGRSKEENDKKGQNKVRKAKVRWERIYKAIRGRANNSGKGQSRMNEEKRECGGQINVRKEGQSDIGKEVT